MNRLVIIDGNAILHRAYHALPQWRDEKGEATSGVYGFLSMLLKVREELQPHYLAVVFDLPTPTFRHMAYVAYQHGRNKDRQMEEDIWGQVHKLTVRLPQFGIPVYQLEGFEADDVIGTLTEQAVERRSELTSVRRGRSGLKSKSKSKKKGASGDIGEVVVVTGDRDLFQLVSDKVKVFLPTKGITEAVVMGRQEVFDKMGVWPEQIIDYKALVGDASDNYPGVPGIGPVTARELLRKFRTVDLVYRALLKKADEITPPVAQKLAEGQEGAELSKMLATIRRDAPITLDLESARMP
jgi:DNA polymerase-1